MDEKLKVNDGARFSDEFRKQWDLLKSGQFCGFGKEAGICLATTVRYNPTKHERRGDHSKSSFTIKSNVFGNKTYITLLILLICFTIVNLVDFRRNDTNES